MQVVKITGESREETGKVYNKTLRAEGKIPAILYGGGENIAFSTTPKEVKSIVYTPDFKVAELEIDGKTYRAVLKDIQFHPVTDEILHIDFLNLVENHPVKLEVPIHFVGEAPGVRNGGTLIRKMRKIKIKTTPEHMVDALETDVSKMTLGTTIRVSDLEVADEIELLAYENTPIASVIIPRVVLEVTPEDEEEEDFLEGEEGEEMGAAEGEGTGAEGAE